MRLRQPLPAVQGDTLHIVGVGDNRIGKVCTKRYVEKANRGKGGVSYEKMIVSAELVKNLDAENLYL